MHEIGQVDMLNDYLAAISGRKSNQADVVDMTLAISTWHLPCNLAILKVCYAQDREGSGCPHCQCVYKNISQQRGSVHDIE